MKERLWSFLAALIYHCNLADFIIWLGQRNPYSHLFHLDGTPYMSRWWLMPRFLLTPDETGHLRPYSWLPIIIRLHHIHTSDYDRDLHDHPADYRTIILRGWYFEQDIYGDKYFRFSGDTKAARAENFHLIKEVSAGGVWTIFIMRKKTNEWGFLVNDRKIPWRKYWSFKNGGTPL